MYPASSISTSIVLPIAVGPQTLPMVIVSWAPRPR
jgi:hypothetical protein